jgi:cell fate (sporulation/competence/biofilm development) regulator YlbF (YheA/YmcA/DUF963 family)
MEMPPKDKYSKAFDYLVQNVEDLEDFDELEDIPVSLEAARLLNLLALALVHLETSEKNRILNQFPKSKRILDNYNSQSSICKLMEQSINMVDVKKLDLKYDKIDILVTKGKLLMHLGENENALRALIQALKQCEVVFGEGAKNHPKFLKIKTMTTTQVEEIKAKKAQK